MLCVSHLYARKPTTEPMDEKKIIEGLTEDEIYDYLKNQYGQWILYDPELNKKTFILWILPILLFLLGGAIIVKKIIIRKK